MNRGKRHALNIKGTASTKLEENIKNRYYSQVIGMLINQELENWIAKNHTILEGMLIDEATSTATPKIKEIHKMEENPSLTKTQKLLEEKQSKKNRKKTDDEPF